MAEKTLKPPIHLRQRCEENPEPAIPAKKQQCGNCGAAVWTDMLTWRKPIARTGTIICTVCMAGFLGSSRDV